MFLLRKVTKIFAHVKAYFTRGRGGHPVASAAGQASRTDKPRDGQTDAQPTLALPAQPRTTPISGPSQALARNRVHSTENPQPSCVPSPAKAPPTLVGAAPSADGQALVTDPGKETWLSKGFALFKSALEITKEFAEPFPPLKYAATGLLLVMQGFEKVNGVQEEFAHVAQKLMFMQTTYDEHRLKLEASESIKASVESLARAMSIVEKMVEAKSARGLFQRISENPSDVKAVADALRMLGDVVDQFIMSITISTHTMLFEGLQDQVLDKLAFADTAQFLSIENGRLCAEGTRAEFLADLLAWTMADDKPSICWVNGAAGSGKTTIAYTLCSVLRGLGLLGGSFFCSRDADNKRRSTKFIFSTLARSLAHYDSDYAGSLAKALKEPGAGSVIASQQLTNLIAAPIRSAHSNGSSFSTPARILVIDALDECGDDDKTIYNLIRRLLAECRGLRLKFLITSRPESHIIRAFENAEQDSYLLRRVQDIPDEVAKIDIRTYLETELKECARSCGIGNGWPPPTQVRALELQAGTLFIYASTACRYIWEFDDDPKDRLAALTAVHAEPLRGIDPMYELILNRARQSKSDHVWDKARRCLQAIVCLSRPLSLGDLGDLLDMDRRDVRTALAGLQSVLRIPSFDTSDAIAVFHASFPDYVLDGNRSRGKDWFVESASVHRHLLQRCITIMTSNLCFNISHSRTSYCFNDSQPIKPTLSGALRYSCLHWIDHLEGCGDTPDSELAELSKLFMERFLYWLEVLSITGEVRSAPTVMTRLLNWLHAHKSVACVLDAHFRTNSRMTAPGTTPADLGQFTRDARDFVNRFAQPIEESCPHIYLSALASTASTSTVWTKISPMFRGLPRIVTRKTQRVSPIFILQGHEGSILSVSFSWDGACVVSSSSDGTILLWDAATGVAIGDPIRGHKDAINSVAFSPDGTRVVSGSWDRTIRLWDAGTGAAIGDPLCGHEDWVRSVAFSPDGMRVVSGSDDRTIRLWNAATGTALGDPLRGHEGLIRSVAFSPDGTRVVSGSSDFTIRLWDATTGAAIGGPLRGHAGDIWSVAFSPDGIRVVSGSSDSTIRLWDAAAGAAIGDPFRGHKDPINSVAFSPDGMRIVSGSSDCTIRLWDAATGAAVGDPFRGHERLINSVAFSRDGKHVVSSSDDGTIRLWDAATAAINNSIRGHEGDSNSVACSPNGTRIVSGSDDRTIQMWDVATGEAIGDPIRGHDDIISSVAFSPDGKCIVSGSDDRTIRLWDAGTGAAIGDPIRGHEGGINSVAFSPEGMRVVSGSDDGTIRLWDSATGAVIGDPIRGHESVIWSVAFSPDGSRVVSGSSDSTIRLWDAAKGTAIGDPLLGHDGFIWSVAFSPDGAHVISGSSDSTIRLWDAGTGAAIGDPLRDHEGGISSVAFSPDGMRVVSGSSDCTIRVWDVATRAAIGDPIRGHQSVIWSVAFSPDGTGIVCGSSDRIIRLWDAPMGATSGDPIRTDDDTKSRAPIDDAIQDMNYFDVTSANSRDSGTPSVVGPTHTTHSISKSDHLYTAAFSPISAHATGVDALLPPGFDLDPRDAFILDERGWLLGPYGERFLWILPEYRRGLWWPRTKSIMGVHPVVLDLSRFVHGEDWTKCFWSDDTEDDDHTRTLC